MTNKRLTLDTNILIYAIDRDAGKKHEMAMQTVESAMDMDCILTIQALAEFYSAATRKGYASHDRVAPIIDAWRQVFPVVGNNEKVLMRAMQARANYDLSFWDAMIWAAAKEASCTLLLTEDFTHNQKIEGVLIQNPFIKGLS
jgi:predicted nucleic acid-binding protein